jgi:hypothetical protein
MNSTMLCPACLDELPDDYPYDHVAIDRALTSQPERITTMDSHERREVILTGLARDMTVTGLASQFHWRTGQIRALLPADHPESTANARKRRLAERAELDATVRDLWDHGLPDTEIALRSGHSVYAIADTRRRLGLATLSGRHWLLPGGVR